MDDSGESRQGEPDVPEEGENWVERQLGEGWTEVEAGIYRFAAGEINEAGIRLAPSAKPAAGDVLMEALHDLERRIAAPVMPTKAENPTQRP
jgi:hypothetical protein